MRIREAHPDDTPGMAKVQVDTKKAYYPPFYPQDILDNLSYDRTASSWRRNLWEHPTPPGVFAYVAEDDENDNQMVGILIGGPDARNDPLYRGEIYVLYVVPAYHRRGAGSALLLSAAQRMVQEGYPNLLIWVLEKNPSRAFYESIGGVVVRTGSMNVSNCVLPEVGYGWANLRTLVERLEEKIGRKSPFKKQSPGRLAG